MLLCIHMSETSVLFVRRFVSSRRGMAWHAFVAPHPAYRKDFANRCDRKRGVTRGFSLGDVGRCGGHERTSKKVGYLEHDGGLLIVLVEFVRNSKRSYKRSSIDRKTGLRFPKM